MTAEDTLTLQQRAALWSLDFDLCDWNQHGTTDLCRVAAEYELICTHCNYVRPVCPSHAAAISHLITRHDDLMPVWTCTRCRRRSEYFTEVFHLHSAEGNHHG